MVKNALFKRASIPKFPELHFPARFFKNYKKIKNSDKQVENETIVLQNDGFYKACHFNNDLY